MLIAGLFGATCLVTAFVTTAYLAYLFALNRTELAVVLRRNGYRRCSHYQHEDILFGSDYQKAAAAASASGNRGEWMRGLFAKYGKTFETGIWGKRIFHTCDAANVQALLTASTTDVGVGPSRAGLVSWLGPGAFTVDGEAWKESREMLKPVFKRTAISDMSRLDRHLNRLLSEVEREGYLVDLQPHFVRMFLDFSMDLLIGEDANTVNKDSSRLDAESFIAACDQAQLQVVRLMRPWLVRWWNGWTKIENHPFDTTQGFVDRYVQSAVKDFEAPGSGAISRSPALLDEMIREVGTQDQVFIRNQILNVFMPGRDSVAIMASHIFFRLARSPAVYEKVRDEVLAAGLEQLSYENLKSLSYINAVVNETLRLGGPLNGVTARDVINDIVLPRGGGQHGDEPMLVPRGSIVYVQIQALHRDESMWPDPHIFRPERWLESSKTSQNVGYEYMPFGGGRRTCPAMRLVMNELVYIVAAFAMRFKEIQNRGPEEQLFEVGSIVMKIRNGVQVELVQ